MQVSSKSRIVKNFGVDLAPCVGKALLVLVSALDSQCVCYALYSVASALGENSHSMRLQVTRLCYAAQS